MTGDNYFEEIVVVYMVDCDRQLKVELKKQKDELDRPSTV